MTALLDIVVKVWPFVLAAAGVLFGVFRHQQAKVATAKADQRIAEAEARAAQNDAALSKANEDAATQTAASAKERTDVENRVADAAPGDAARSLRDYWTRN
jgi:hypothetical protein